MCAVCKVPEHRNAQCVPGEQCAMHRFIACKVRYSMCMVNCIVSILMSGMRRAAVVAVWAWQGYNEATAGP